MALLNWAMRKMARVNLRALVEGRHHDRAEQSMFDAIVAALVEERPNDATAIQDGIQAGFWRIFGSGPNVTFSPGELLDAAAAMERRWTPVPTDRDRQKSEKFRELDRLSAGSVEVGNNAKATWLVSRGNHYGDRGMLDEAMQDFEEALRLKSDHLPAHVSRVLVYATRGDHTRAEQLVAEMPEEGRLDGVVIQTKEEMIKVLSKVMGEGFAEVLARKAG